MIDKDSIIKLLGIESLPDEQKLRIVDQSAQLVEQRVLVRILKTLPDNSRDEFQKILDSGQSEKMDKFLAEKVPDLFKYIDEETLVLKEELKALGEQEI